MSWPEIPLGDLYAEPSRNGTYKSKEHHGEGVKIVNMGELFGHDFIGGQEMKRLRMSNAEMTKFGLSNGDLLFGRRSLVESGAGKCSLVEALSEPTTFESSIIRVRVDPRRLMPRFLFYWLKSPLGKGRIRAIVSGTNVKGIKGSTLKTVRVPSPPMQVQARVVSQLIPYDDLVFNNCRRIELLEDAARLLYREWFVHLRFPGHEHVAVTDGVPDGWRKRRIGDIAPLKYGKALRTDDRIPGPIPVYGSSGVIGTHEKPLVTGPGIIVGRKGNVGSVHWCAGDYHPIDTVYYIEAKHCTTYLYYALLHAKFISTDVAVPGLNRDYAHSREVLLPDPRFLSLFEDHVAEMREQIALLTSYGEALREARDLLLPRLMNGDVAA